MADDSVVLLCSSSDRRGQYGHPFLHRHEGRDYWLLVVRRGETVFDAEIAPEEFQAIRPESAVAPSSKIDIGPELTVKLDRWREERGDGMSRRQAARSIISARIDSDNKRKATPLHVVPSEGIRSG